MKYGLSLAALGAALIMSGCIVPVDRNQDGGNRSGYGNERRDCSDRNPCDRHDHEGDQRDDHGRP